MNRGILYGSFAYVLWGFFPIYWKFLHDVPALQVVSHRIGWSFIFLIGFILIQRQWKHFRAASFNWRTIQIYAGAGILLSANWLTYVWGVHSGKIVEASLGYFINPLLSVLLGVLFLREKLRPTQWVPVLLAAVGVAYLTYVYGRLPWIALLLAFSFGFYGLLKKLAPLGSLYGLTLETAILFPASLAYLLVMEGQGTGAFLHVGAQVDLLLCGAGIITTIPLLLFASAAKEIPLTTLGILQYIAPILQFLIGVLVYKEAFDFAHFVGFGIVWTALLLFWVENARARC